MRSELIFRQLEEAYSGKTACHVSCPAHDQAAIRSLYEAGDLERIGEAKVMCAQKIARAFIVEQ